jgi:hypothetical protein
VVRRDTPAEYTVPPFPSLFWPPQDGTVILYELDDMWKFTLYWTLILYGLFHLGAVGVAVLMQGGKRSSSWKYLWLVPLVYALIAAFEGLLAGTLVGLMWAIPIRLFYLSDRADAQQSRRELHRRRLYNVDLDPLRLGVGQRPGPAGVLVSDPRRSVIAVQNTAGYVRHCLCRIPTSNQKREGIARWRRCGSTYRTSCSQFNARDRRNGGDKSALF